MKIVNFFPKIRLEDKKIDCDFVHNVKGSSCRFWLEENKIIGVMAKEKQFSKFDTLYDQGFS